MFKINLFYPIEYRQNIRNYLTLENESQGHLKSMALENY